MLAGIAVRNAPAGPLTTPGRTNRTCPTPPGRCPCIICPGRCPCICWTGRCPCIGCIIGRTICGLTCCTGAARGGGAFLLFCWFCARAGIVNVNPNTPKHIALMNDFLIRFPPARGKYATTAAVVDSILLLFGLRRVERRLPQPSHQTMKITDLHRSREVELLLAGCSRIVEGAAMCTPILCEL